MAFLYFLVSYTIFIKAIPKIRIISYNSLVFIFSIYYDVSTFSIFDIMVSYTYSQDLSFITHFAYQQLMLNDDKSSI